MIKMTKKEFREYVKKHDENMFKGDGIADLLKDVNNNHFAIICKKCGSLNIEVLGEDGVDYGELTGYCPGTNVIKCKDCGNAVTIWN